MSLVALQLLDGSAVSVEATLVTSSFQLPASLIPSTVAAATRLTVAGAVYDVLGTKAAVDLIIAGGAAFGAQYFYNADEVGGNITSATFSTILSQTRVLPAGNYRVSWNIEWQMTSGGVAIAEGRIDIDASSGSSSDGTTVSRPSDYSGLAIYNAFSGFGVSALTAGSHVFRFKLRNTTGAGTIIWRMARLEIVRVS